MFNNKINFLILFISFFWFGCKQEENVSNEQKVYEDIFPELISETFKDFRKMPPIIPPPSANPSEEEIDMLFENHKKYIDTTNFAPLYVLVNDSVLSYANKTLKSIYKSNKFIDTTLHKKPFKIDLSKIKVSDDYILKYRSENPADFNVINFKEREKYPNEVKHLRQYSGMLYLYRIFFNKEQDYGMLWVGYNCGKLCGCSYKILIKKVDGKWRIDVVDNLGCS